MADIRHPVVADMAEAIFKGAPHLAGHTSKPYLRKQRKHNSTADEKKGPAPDGQRQAT